MLAGDDGTGWLRVTKVDKAIEVEVEPNFASESARKASIEIRSLSTLVETVVITQNGMDSGGYIIDGELTNLQRHTKGLGVALVLMGDGYTLKDMVRNGGKYESEMREAVENFFSVYPYNEYREYFDVWMVGAISKEEGMTIKSPDGEIYEYVDNRFQSFWSGPGTATIKHDQLLSGELVDQVATKIGKSSRNDLTVIMLINADVYAGTALLSTNGYSIAQCPVLRTPPTTRVDELQQNFRNVIVHEVGGHAFAKLTDEYVYDFNATIDEMKTAEVKRYQAVDMWKNVDLNPEIDKGEPYTGGADDPSRQTPNGDLSKTLWAGFEGKTGYSMVGAYEGAYLSGKGIWRSEYTSCMVNNSLYFNAVSRWQQIRWILKRAGMDDDFTIDEFIAVDKRPAAITSRAAAHTTIDPDFVPLAPPVIID
jgi:hypothetical protein